MRKRITSSAVGLVLALAGVYITLAIPTIFPTGTTIYKPAECYSSYILIADHASLGNHPSAAVRAQSVIPDDIRLIDMNGRVVHTWKVLPHFNKRCRLLPNGHLLNVGPDKTIFEYDWEGNIVWTHEGIDSINDMRWLPNNNRLFLAHDPLPEAFQLQVEDVEISPWWPLRKRGSEETQLGGDIYEVTPDKKIVWEWHAYNHLDLNRFSPVTPEGDWLHMNTISPLPENKWYDAGDKRFKPGNILINPRNIDTLYIVDKDTKEIVWEWTHHYKGGLAHCHEPEMIEKGLPGEGNIILFDNGLFPRHRTHCGQTFIIELDPVTGDIVWKYETEGYANLKFFSKTMGTQKRLPNGNTFIAEDNTGRLFQVKPDGEIVWEYVNRGGTCRPFPVPYDYCPQLKALPKPPEHAVTPPNNLEWHLQPDAFRDRDTSAADETVLIEKDLKLAFITCAVNADFFRPVKKGMRDAAKMLGVHCDFLGTEGVDLAEQVKIIRHAVNSGYDGMAVNIIDPQAFDDIIQEAIDSGVPVVGFNTDDHNTPNARLSSVNQQLYQAGRRLAEFVLPRIPEGAHILMTMHDEGISALEDRLRGIQEALEPRDVKATVIIPGNDAERGKEVIAEALRKYPDIRIILCTGQADTEAAGRAIEAYFPDAGYWAAGFDLSAKTLNLIQDGHILGTVDQQPYVQGFYPVMQLVHYLRYGIMPADVDAGATIIDKSAVPQVMELTRRNYR